MSVLVPFNGTNYLIPTSGETGWATSVSNFLSDVGNNAVVKSTATITTLNTTTLTATTGNLGTLTVSGSASAPTLTYGANTTGLATAAFVQAAVTPLNDNIGRNLLHNGTFVVQQRGQGPFVNPQYGPDRWAVSNSHSNGSSTITLVSLTDTDRSQIGDEAATSSLRCQTVGGTGTTDFDIFIQRIEGVRNLSNKTVTVSFWAVASSGTPKIAIEMEQAFGTGGSPSTVVSGIGSTAFTLSATWQRYTAAITLPSVSGKTLGTNGDDNTHLNIWLSAGSSFAARAASIGVQTSTVSFWGFQMEVGTVATPLEKRPIAIEAALCQRFFQIGQCVISGYGLTGSGVGQTIPFIVQPRGPMAVTITTNSSTNVTGLTPNSALNGGAAVWIAGSVTATGNWTMNCIYTASADL